ncbi:hypothetical protein C8J57DRAFT_1257238 [Mycena rebaudengoi]|nr:hypothetical protein C8J57DRAFT_1257238 [Mycena rebaudengoi]
MTPGVGYVNQTSHTVALWGQAEHVASRHVDRGLKFKVVFMLGVHFASLCPLRPPDNTTHPVKLDGTYGPNVPSNLTGMCKFPYHGYTTCIMAVSLYHAYHGTPQTCGGMKNTPNTFLDATGGGRADGGCGTTHTTGDHTAVRAKAKYHAYPELVGCAYLAYHGSGAQRGMAG